MLKPGTTSESQAATEAVPLPSPPQPEARRQIAPGVTTASIVLLTIAALYFGRDIFLPFTLAVLLSFLLAPLVAGLRHLHVPRVAAVVMVVAFAVALIGGLSVLVGSQMVNIANNLPSYQKTMQEKVRAIRSAAPGGGAIDRTTQVIQALGRELSESSGTSAEGRSADSARAKKEPIPVRIEHGVDEPMTLFQNVISPVLGPIGTAGLVIVFIFFVLLEPSDLRDRFIRLAGSDLHRTTEALSEAAERVSRYLLMQLVVNVTYGLPIGLGLYLIGVPGAFLWGLLATVLRFIPYLGPVIAAVPPIVLSFAVDPGWSMLLWTAALFLVVELISNNVVEPWLYGSSTGMSPVAVILSAIFWTMLWGPVGLMLATPLTVCLVVMGRYVPQLQFLDVLLGSEPVLAPEERLYQRLLAGNVEEAIEIAETQMAETGMLAFYSETGLPALRLAENARERGASDEDRTKVAEGMLAVLFDVKDQVDRKDDSENAPSRWLGTPVLSIAGRGQLDAAGAEMLVQALAGQGIGANLLPAIAVTLDHIGNIDLAGIEVVCLSYFSPRPKAYARFVCRRLKRRLPRLKIVLGAWNLASEAGPPEQLAADSGADAVATTLEEAVRRIEEMVDQAVAQPSVPPPLPAEEQARIEALHSSGALAASNSAHLDRVAREVAEAFDAPIALVSLIDDSCQLWKGAHGLPERLNQARQGTRETAICTHVVASKAPLVVEDTARDARFAHNPFLREHGFRFYAGVPLRTSSGHVIGSLCVIDLKPRTLTPRELKLLQVVADELMAELAQRASAPHVSEEKPECTDVQLGMQRASAAGS
ncbi:AI-2E family transporter [Noviherbaspirillum massiliense]|uniref:AI-2E family transporter n=1 Tax=Noviherbaspirillum massiliense TaxID=1465823 RepID=UPI00030B1457|nr:AI-2E family transporter [Noviherbaspirillum massiliense]